ncbi:hypothetical protein C814_02019, partial [Anaerotruncus sp. G3(2012)]
FRKALCDLFVLFFLQFHSFIIAYLYLCEQTLGQMQMYVNYYTREMMNEGDSQPIGIVLCADKGDSIVKYTLPEDNRQIFASKYFTYLPSEEELKRELNLDSFYKMEE